MTSRRFDFTAHGKEKVLDRDGRECVLCDRTGGLTVHHRIPVSAFRAALGAEPSPAQVREAKSRANGLTLCRWCHALIEEHRSFAASRGWLIDLDELRSAPETRHLLRSTPVLYPREGWFLLGGSGRRRVCEPVLDAALPLGAADVLWDAFGPDAPFEIPREAGEALGLPSRYVVSRCRRWALRGVYDYGVAEDLGWKRRTAPSPTRRSPPA